MKQVYYYPHFSDKASEAQVAKKIAPNHLIVRDGARMQSQASE